MCCSECCTCDRNHGNAYVRLRQVRAVVIEVMRDFDLARYGVRVVPIDRPSVDAMLETWRDELTEKMIDEVTKAVGFES